MLSWLNNFFKNEEREEGISCPKNAQAHFILKYKKLTIAYLSRLDDKWVFQYSDEFKNQHKISILLNFPAKDQKYEASCLWPFFAHRIPGLGQPQIQKIIKDEKLNPKNEIELLRRFGRRSITNPFELVATV